MLWKFFKKPPPHTATSTPTTRGPGIDLPLVFLQKLIPISELPIEELQAIPISHRSFTAGQIIFNRGEHADSMMYLYTGHVFLEAGNGSGYSVEEATFKAYYPLTTDIEHQFSAIAKTTSQILYFPLSALKSSAQASLANKILLEPSAIPPDLIDSDFFNGFCDAFRRDELQVPSLPDVALKLRKALQKDINIADAAKIINLDPAIAAKLIQVTNSPLYRTVNPTTSSHNAINRLGLKTTQNLVTSISMRNLFRSSNKQLNTRVQLLWRQSIQIASLSYTLASLSKSINPDEALLAGLTHNIGTLPIITYAENAKHLIYTEQELEQTIAALQSLVGAFILKKWNFPAHLQLIPSQSNNWYYDDNPILQLNDIVLLARFHAQLGSTQNHQLPPLVTLPAFTKLGERALTHDMSLLALQEAKQQIAEALSFFRS